MRTKKLLFTKPPKMDSLTSKLHSTKNNQLRCKIQYLTKNVLYFKTPQIPLVEIRCLCVCVCVLFCFVLFLFLFLFFCFFFVRTVSIFNRLFPKFSAHIQGFFRKKDPYLAILTVFKIYANPVKFRRSDPQFGIFFMKNGTLVQGFLAKKKKKEKKDPFLRHIPVYVLTRDYPRGVYLIRLE